MEGMMFVQDFEEQVDIRKPGRRIKVIPRGQYVRRIT